MKKRVLLFTMLMVAAGSLNPISGSQNILDAKSTSDEKVVSKKDTNNVNEVMLKLDKKIITVDGVEKEIDVAPILEDNRTYVPFRAIAEELGGKVSWDDATRKITIRMNTNTTELWLESTKIVTDGVEREMDVVPKIKNGRTMIPIRYVAESLGYDVGWNQGEIKINKKADEIKKENNKEKKEMSFPKVEKIEKISGYIGNCWVNDDVILGYGNPLSPAPHGPNITYPDRPVKFYNLVNKAAKAVDDFVMYRFDDMSGVLSPDNKHTVFFMSKGNKNEVFDVDSNKRTEIKFDGKFYNHAWINDKEFVAIKYDTIEGKSIVCKCDTDGNVNKIGTLEGIFDVLFMLDNKLYFLKTLVSNNGDSTREIYRSDLSLYNFCKIADIKSDVKLVGNEIIQKELIMSPENDYKISNCTITKLDKGFKESGKIISDNTYEISMMDINKDYVIYTKSNDEALLVECMNIASGEIVELFNSKKDLEPKESKYSFESFGISKSGNKIFVSFNKMNEEEYEGTDTIAISLKRSFNEPTQEMAEDNKINDKAQAKFIYDEESLTLNGIPVSSKKVTEEDLIKAFGKPLSKKNSEAAFLHYIYEFEGGLEISYFEQYGIIGFSMTKEGSFIKKDLKIGDTFDKVKSAYGEQENIMEYDGMKVLGHIFEKVSSATGEIICGAYKYTVKDNVVIGISFEKHF